MKKFLILAVVALAALVSCGSDDEWSAKITETDNTLTLVMDDPTLCKTTWTATFDSEDLCIKYIEEEKYYDKEEADYEWSDAREKDPTWTRNGKTITHDATAKHLGETRAKIRAYFETFLGEE